MTRRVRGPEAYARQLERALSRVRERPVVLSPRDWELLSEWYSRGIPLAIVEQAMEAASEREASKKRRPARRGLAYVAPAVDGAENLLGFTVTQPLWNRGQFVSA